MNRGVLIEMGRNLALLKPPLILAAGTILHSCLIPDPDSGLRELQKTAAAAQAQLKKRQEATATLWNAIQAQIIADAPTYHKKRQLCLYHEDAQACTDMSRVYRLQASAGLFRYPDAVPISPPAYPTGFLHQTGGIPLHGAPISITLTADCKRVFRFYQRRVEEAGGRMVDAQRLAEDARRADSLVQQISQYGYPQDKSGADDAEREMTYEVVYEPGSFMSRFLMCQDIIHAQQATGASRTDQR